MRIAIAFFCEFVYDAVQSIYKEVLQAFMDSDSDEANNPNLVCHLRSGISGYPLGHRGVFFCAHF